MSLLTNLVCYLKLDEAANVTRADASGNGNNFADSNADVGSAVGLIGNAATFTTGAGDRLENSSQLLPSGAFSVSIWLKANLGDLTGVAYLFSASTVANATKQFIRISAVSQAVQGSVSISNDVSSDVSTILDGVAFHHFVLTFDPTVAAGTVTLYVDGVSVSVATSKTFAGGGVLTRIGNLSSVTAAKTMTLDECGMWSRALTASEVTSLYNGGAGFTYPFTTRGSDGKSF